MRRSPSWRWGSRREPVRETTSNSSKCPAPRHLSQTVSLLCLPCSQTQPPVVKAGVGARVPGFSAAVRLPFMELGETEKEQVRAWMRQQELMPK